MTDCLVSSGGLGGGPGISVAGGGSSSSSGGGGDGSGPGDQEQPRLSPALEMFAAAAAAAAVAASNVSTIAGSAATVPSTAATTVSTSSNIGSMDPTPITSNPGSQSSLRHHSPPSTSSSPSTASDTSVSGTCGRFNDNKVEGDGCCAIAATTINTSNSGATCIAGSGRIREKHLMQLINSDPLEPFGYGPSHEQQQQQQQSQSQLHPLSSDGGDESHSEIDNVTGSGVSSVDDNSAIGLDSFGNNIEKVPEHNNLDQENQDALAAVLNASENQKDLIMMVYKKLQQEQQERERMKRLQMLRKSVAAESAQSIESKLQQASQQQLRQQHLHREGDDKQLLQQMRNERDNGQSPVATAALDSTSIAATTLSGLLENLNSCTEVGGVDVDEKLLMRLMRNSTTQVKSVNDIAPVADTLTTSNKALGSNGGRRDGHHSPRPQHHDHLGSNHDNVLGNLERADDVGDLNEGEVGCVAIAVTTTEISAARSIGSTSQTSYQSHIAPTANVGSFLMDDHDEDELIGSHHDEDDDEEDNDDLLGGSLEGDDDDGVGSGGGGTGGDGVCGVCREAYSQPPRVLNCLHVFCEACLAKLRSKKRPAAVSNFGQMSTKAPVGGGFVVRCPKCQVETECAHGVQTLPLDYVLINRLDTEAIYKRTAVCTSCKSEDSAIARCQDCSNFLCSNCRKAHSSMLCFENHKVVSFETFDQERAQIHRAVSCLRHPRKVAVLYDPVCGTVMCNDCLVAGHQGHGCKKALHFDSRERTELQSLLNDARQKFNAFDDANDALTTSLSELQLTRDSVRSSIEETFITYKNLLERAKDVALEELEKVHSSQEMRVMDDIQQCQESRVHLEHALAFAEKLVKYGDASEFLALKTLVTSRVRKLTCSCPQSKDQGELRFVTDEAKFAQAVRTLFGHVVPTSGSRQQQHQHQQQQQENNLLQTVQPPSSDNTIGGLDSSHNSVSSVGSGTAGSLLSSPFAPDISNTSAAGLLPSDIVDAVNSSASSMVPPGPHFGSLEHAASGVVHPILPPGGPLSAGGPPSLPALDPIVAPAEINELRSALAQYGLATLAGVEQVDVLPTPDVLPLLVRDVATGPRGMVVGGESSRIGPPTGPPSAVSSGPTEEENHLMNNLSALAKMGPMGPASYAGSPVPLNGHGAPLRGGSGPVAPLAIGAGPLSAGLDASSCAPGQRSPTSSVASVTLSSSTPGPAINVSSTGNSSSGGSSAGRGTRVTPMHIRIKFGQLGSGPTQFSSPHGFCLGPNEEIVVADTNNHRMQIFDKAGELKSEFGTQGKEEGQLWYPRKVAVMKSTGTYVICDRGNERSRMQLFTKNGEFIKKIAIRYIDIVAGLALTSDGRIVAVDSVSPTVFVIAETGDLLLWFDCSEHMREPSDIAVWGTEFYICDFKGHCVVVYNECGSFLRRIGGEGLTNFPNGIDISDHGDILVGDSHGNRFHIVVFNRDGQAISEFECPYCKVSRCCGLKITSEGYVVTLAKNNHHVLVLNTLYIT